MYCVYLTIYSGNRLPRRYIGSSSVSNVLSGYNGSIKSKKYKTIYKEEQLNSKYLFKTRILSYHETHKEAIEKELQLHIRYNVVKSENYMNMSNASPNGYFGRNITGKDHHFYGKTHSKETREKISNCLKEKYLNGMLISPFTFLDVSGKNNPFYGKTHSEESKNLMRKPKKFVPKFTCPCCNKEYDGGNLTQHLRRKGWTDDEINLYKKKL